MSRWNAWWEVKVERGGKNCVYEFELTYGPGIVQKLRAHFLELSKEQPAVVAHVRSPRFKRLKIAEIRRRNSSSSDKFNDSNNNSQDLIASGFTNKLAGKDKSRSSSSAYSNIQKVPGVHVGKITSLDQPNGIYIHRAAAIRTVARANRKVKTFDSIREKFETCSNRCSSVPHKKRGATAMKLGAPSGTVRVIVELTPNDDVVSVPFIVNQPPISPNVSSMLDAEQVQMSESHMDKRVCF
ncbi:unnamed protein product [Gongylonema pulchrum]|uniref:Agenet domain-containing protein n=1 Tax=Gongylonema pulchrum TaxID=637853 RepID=A0A183E0H5_9BILA|nr:unnamed protein product [Gongylonema pulchrum]